MIKLNSARTLDLFCAKSAPKNIKYSRNTTILKIGHLAEAITHAKSSLWVKKLKFQKTCQNPFYKSFRVVLCKKPIEKTPNIPEMRAFMGYSPLKIFSLGQKLKFRKTCQNPFYNSFTVVLCKKPLEKKQNIPEMRAF